jgi:cobalt-zinc-cadmium efflux system outer membrane protein
VPHRERDIAQAVETRAAARAAAQELRAARDRVNHQRNVILPLRDQILNETQKHYNAMQVGAFQLLQAKQAQVDAGARYVELLRDYWLARAAIDQLAAGGAAEISAARSTSSASGNNPSQGGH